MGNPWIDLVVAIFVFGAFIAMVGRLSGSNPYDRIGAGGTSLPDDAPDAVDRSHEAQRQRESEIRQILEARSERLVRMGQPPLDLDAETERLLRGGEVGAWSPKAGTGDSEEERGKGVAHRHDPQLVEELRQLADARNSRRIKRGEPALDVDVEVARALAELE